MVLHRLAGVTDLRIGGMKACAADGVSVLLLRLPEGVRAYENRCAQTGTLPSEGKLTGRVLTCGDRDPCQFDAWTGAALNPGDASLKRYEVRIAGGDIFVALPASIRG